MVTRKNKDTNTAYAENVTPSGLGFYYTMPIRGAVATHQLKIRSGKSTVKLSGSQVRSLTRVISTVRRLAK